MLIREVPDSLPGYQVSLEQAIVWSAREQRLHGTQSEVLEFHLKLDGRPLFGKDQVSVGIVPGNHPYLSSQSALTVRPLAIANIEESRKEIKVLVRDINRQKDVIKRNGVVVDGKLFQVKFKVIIDYKAFCLLLCKKDDENFRLGGKGFGEFCMFCHALRLCAECNLGSHQVCLKHFAMTKANIGGFTGIRDDLTLLLDENMTAVNICALHCELRNMEQLLASLGLFCHKIGSLAECNAALKEYGPQTMKKDRIRISTKPGQETMVEKHNVKVASFSGPTERKFLQNSTVIVERSLPLPKLKEHFRDVEAAKLFVLNKITFYQERVLYFQALKDNEKFVRDFGTHQEEINIKDQAVGKRIDELLKSWKEKVDDVSNKFTEALKHNTSSRKKPKKKKRLQAYEENDVLGTLAADLALECYIKVFSGWNDIALVMRKKLFKQDEEHLIDLFDIQCKEWGFLLREVFGLKLGTGDYGHMAIEHASMLLRNHRSIGAMSTQGFESSHKVHRQLYLRATSHDVSEGISSIDQILTHQYAEYFLFLRLSFRKALECLNKSSAFHFSGCYWSLKLGSEKKKMWTSEDIWWMSQMDSLLTLIFGVDYPRYAYQKAKSPSGSVRNGACIVQEEDVPSYKYVHNEWEKSYQQRLQEYKSQYASPQNPGQSPSQHAAPPSPVSRQSSSQHAAPPPPVSTTTLSSTNPLELLCRNPGLTRGQLASLNIPPVAYIKDSDITLVQNIQCNNLKDPFSLICRPSEAVVDRALKLLRDHVHSGGIIGADDNHSFVSLGTFGTFTGEALEVIKSFCFAAEIKQKVREELTWLGREDSVVRETLLSLRPQEEFLNVNGFLMDAKDLSNLACERYVDGYTIDMSCMLFLKKSIHASSIAYLPSHTFTWATADHEFLLKKLTPIISFQSTSKLEKVICPVHVGGCHWGILCLDFSQEIAYYDDGMHMEPPTNISAAVTKIMKVLTCLRPSMSSILWSGGKVPFQRFGMPKQPSSGEGSSSCGIGVIFAARDIIEYRRPGIPSFSWSFSDSSKLRKRIINELISARIHASGQ